MDLQNSVIAGGLLECNTIIRTLLE
jgi:hypothetical protein